MRPTIEEINSAIDLAKGSFGDVIKMMPSRAFTSGQRKLMKKHGSPRVFARAVVAAIGEISCLEAAVAIRKYFKQWQDA